MPTILYLDVDDEITSAAARMRASAGGPVGLVVPTGSRVATSRINFRLLAREAQARGRDLAIVSGDGATRALAASAGLAAFASVGEYEASLAPDGTNGEPSGGGGAAGRGGAEGAGDDTGTVGGVDAVGGGNNGEANRFPVQRDAGTGRPTAERTRRTRKSDLDATAVVPTVLSDDAAAARRPADDGLPAQRSIAVIGPRRRVRGRAALFVGFGLLLVALVVGGVAAFVFLPSATITLTPRVDTIGPVTLEVRADPAVTSPQPDAGVVPAERLSFDLTATDSFPATGVRVEESKANGVVRFDSVNTVGPVAVPAGTRVSTLGGVVFATTEAVTVPPAEVAGESIKHGFVDAPVVASAAGPAGNVDANEITQVPDTLSTQRVSVGNPQPTSGGAREEFPRVEQVDVDAAVEQLTRQLGEQFDARLRDPASAPPDRTLFPETATLADPVPSVDPATLVGQEVASFELSLTATGAVTTVDQRPLTGVAEEHIRGQIDADHRLVDESIEVTVGEAETDGDSLVFPVTVEASQVMVIDRDALLSEIKGRSVPQARAILEPYGDVELSVWPDWVTSIPTVDGRTTLRIDTGVADPSETAPA